MKEFFDSGGQEQQHFMSGFRVKDIQSSLISLEEKLKSLFKVSPKKDQPKSKEKFIQKMKEIESRETNQPNLIRFHNGSMRR